jgi:predicted transcriptional regulator
MIPAQGETLPRFTGLVAWPFSGKIDDTLKSRIQRLASQRRRSPRWIMLEAVQQYDMSWRSSARKRRAIEESLQLACLAPFA